MIYLDSDTDSILPYGLKGTPFETVFKALQAVASTVWPVDAAELRAAIGWGWYLDNNLEELILLSAGKQYIQNILISEQIPLIKSTQTQEELVDLLYRWKNYKPTFDKLEELYIPYAARVDIRPITDEATQEILPVTDIHNAFYVVLTDIDWSRPLTLGEAALIAERATPMGSRPIAVFQFEETTNVYPQPVYGDVNFYTGTFEPAAEPVPPAPSELTAYFTNQGSAGTANTSMSSSQSYQLYDASGNALSFDLTKKYTINKYYNISGTEKSVGAYAKCIDVMGNLYLRPNASPTIFRAELSLSPQTTIEAYFTANGSSETTDTYCGSTDTKTLYDASGVPIPYESTKTYTTVASFVVNGDTAYTDFDGNFAAWSDTVLKGRGTNNYYYNIVIRVE